MSRRAKREAAKLLKRVRDTALRWWAGAPVTAEEMEDLLMWVHIRLYEINRAMTVHRRARGDRSDIVNFIAYDLGFYDDTHLGPIVFAGPASELCRLVGWPSKMWWDSAAEIDDAVFALTHETWRSPGEPR